MDSLKGVSLPKKFAALKKYEHLYILDFNGQGKLLNPIPINVGKKVKIENISKERIISAKSENEDILKVEFENRDLEVEPLDIGYVSIITVDTKGQKEAIQVKVVPTSLE